MNFLKGAVYAAIVITALSGNASAQQSDLILRRLEAIEASNAKLEKENASLRERVRNLEGNRQARAIQTEHAPKLADKTNTPETAMAYVPITKAPVNKDQQFNWTGFHLGMHAGYQVNGEIQQDFPSASGFDGWFFGGNAGYDYQFASHWVAGVEADYSVANVQQTNFFFGGSGNSKVDRIGTARGRLGYAWDRYLVYATGGYAWART